jgi:hypothetical protein
MDTTVVKYDGLVLSWIRQSWRHIGYRHHVLSACYFRRHRRHVGFVVLHTLEYVSSLTCTPQRSSTHELHVLFHRLGSAPLVSGDRFVCLTRVLRCARSSDRRCCATLRCVSARLLDSQGSSSMSYKHRSSPEHGGMPKLLLEGQGICAEERMNDIWCALVGFMYTEDAAIMARPAMLCTTAVSL